MTTPNSAELDPLGPISIDLPTRPTDAPKKTRRYAPLIVGGQDTGHRIYEPTKEQMVLLARYGSRSVRSMQEKMQGVHQLLVSVMDPAGVDYLEGRLIDPDDPLEIEHLEALLNAVAERIQHRANHPDQPAPPAAVERRVQVVEHEPADTAAPADAYDDEWEPAGDELEARSGPPIAPGRVSRRKRTDTQE